MGEMKPGGALAAHRYNARVNRDLKATRGVAMRTGVIILSLIWSLAAHGGQLQVTVTDENSAGPARHAVVSLHGGGSASSGPGNARAEMDQRDMQFSPHVLPVQQGTLVYFPNSDDVRHHVYSFSPAKRFELPLYAGRQADPIRFDQTGVVVLGCNIHDSMVGYILVLDTPWFARVDDQGRATLDAPAGDYRLEVWHPRLPENSQPQVFEVSLTGGEPTQSEVNLHLERRHQGPGDGASGRSQRDTFRGFGRDR